MLFIFFYASTHATEPRPRMTSTMFFTVALDLNITILGYYIQGVCQVHCMHLGVLLLWLYYVIISCDMSKIIEKWRQVERAHGLQLQRDFEEMYGKCFSNGINIGREVNDKLKANIKPWPTLLQFEGLDSGLTRGFLTSLGICMVEGQDHLSDLSTVVESYGHGVTFEKIETTQQLTERYPDTDYYSYPSTQQWSMPAVLIHYSVE